MTRSTGALLGSGLFLVTLLAGTVSSQQPPAPSPKSAAPTEKPEEGIPVTDQTVQKACGACHQPDGKGQMSRISFQRNTPEGWQSTIQRMASLNGVPIDPRRPGKS